jgi:hypothetical protein
MGHLDKEKVHRAAHAIGPSKKGRYVLTIHIMPQAKHRKIRIPHPLDQSNNWRLFIDNQKFCPEAALFQRDYGTARFSLTDAARRSGISLNTAKAQLKSVFAQTGFSRQADLAGDIRSNLPLQMLGS